MRIGILTLPPNANYGGILQAYALQTVLEGQGHQVVVFDRQISQKNITLYKRPWIYSKRFIKKYILRKKSLEVFQERKDFNKECIIRANTQIFINSHIHRYVVNKLNDIKKEDFDAIVVGSDQIWRMLYFKSSWNTDKASDAFLGFSKGWNILRIAYAASFGTNETDVASNEIEECKNAIRHFDAISVREEEGVSICHKIFGVNAIKVLDPTMLLTKENYSSLFSNKFESSPNKPFLAKYILDETPQIEAFINRIAKTKSLEIKDTNLAGWGNLYHVPTSQIPVEDWLHCFSEADLIINDSFHATVFSILFHKQFFVIVNKERGASRIISLLGMLGLEDRMITTLGKLPKERYIDYKKVDSILSTERQHSMSFLMNNLRNE